MISKSSSNIEVQRVFNDNNFIFIQSSSYSGYDSLEYSQIPN